MAVKCYSMFVLLAFSSLFILFDNCQASHSRVLVLGAGASGVSFANTLMKSGWTNFTVLEARDYIGGRIRKSKIGSTTIELGANWIHGIGPENAMWLLREKYGLKTAVDDYLNMTVRDENSNIYQNGRSSYEQLNKEANEVAEKSYVAEEEKKADKPLRTSLSQDNLVIDNPVEAVLEYFLIDYENGAPAEQLTARQVAYTGGKGTDHFVKDPRGYAYLVEKLAQNFTHQIHLNTSVTKIHHSNESGVVVETANGTNYTSDYVVVTFPNGVLGRRNLFVPDLPQWKYDAIYRLPMAQYTKIFLRFPAKFWDSTNYALLSNLQYGHYVIWMNLKKPEFFPSENLLLVTVTGSESLRVERLTTAQVTDEVMAVLKKVYGSGIPNPSDLKMSRWSIDPQAYGVYIAPTVGTDSLVFEHMKQPLDKNVWFAGESLEVESFGFTHGALKNGKTQAAAFMSCISNNECPILRMRNATCASRGTSNAHALNPGFFILHAVAVVLILRAMFS